MAITYVGKVGSNLLSGTSGTTIAETVDAEGCAVGSLHVVIPGRETDSTIAVTDSKGNTYSEAKYLGGASGLGIFYSVLTTALVSGDTVTATFSVSAANRIICSHEFTPGVGFQFQLDQTNSKTNTGSPTLHDTGAITTTVNDELIIAAFYFNLQTATPVTPDADYLELDDLATTQRTMEAQYRIVTATLTDTGTATSSVGMNGRAVIASFKLVADAVATRRSNMLLTGVG